MPIRRATHVACSFPVAVDATAAFFARRSPATYVEQTIEDDGVTFRIVVDGRHATTADGSTFAGLLSIRRADCGVALTLRGACAHARSPVQKRQSSDELERTTVTVVRMLLDDLAAVVDAAAMADSGDRGNIVSLDRRRRLRTAGTYERRASDPG